MLKFIHCHKKTKPELLILFILKVRLRVIDCTTFGFYRPEVAEYFCIQIIPLCKFPHKVDEILSLALINLRIDSFSLILILYGRYMISKFVLVSFIEGKENSNTLYGLFKDMKTVPIGVYELHQPR